jgi:hypothetical protein
VIFKMQKFNLSDTAQVIDEKLGKIPGTGETWTDKLGEELRTELIDQTFDASSENAQSGVAVEAAMSAAVNDALTTVRDELIDQTFNASSENAQSGVAVEAALAKLREDISKIPDSPSFLAQAEEPTDHAVLWIDTKADGGLKYYNGSSWVTVPVRFS